MPLVMRLAVRSGWVDRPGGLKNHARIVPYGGGIAILLGWLAGLAWAGALRSEGRLLEIVLASIVVVLGGAWDDWKPLGWRAKLFVQLLASLLLIQIGVHLRIEILPSWLNLLLTVFWLIGMTNAVNIIDIMDGLCGGVCGLAAVTFGVIGVLFGHSDLALLSFSIAGAACGFLAFNLHPARAFMGDAGAQLLGFVLGAAAIEGAYTTFNNIALFAPVLILAIPIYDTALVSFFRLRRGASPFRGSADHMALRLRAMGFSIRATVRICLAVTALMSAAATAATLVTFPVAVSIYGVVVIAALCLGVWLGRVPVGAPAPPSESAAGVSGAAGAADATGIAEAKP
jgi:UDP-GlcNAc:undecaprenyl-phosphate GlcNAc-1-phosphate transferase